MWEPRPLTPLWAFRACYRDSFTFTLMEITKKKLKVFDLYSLYCKKQHMIRIFYTWYDDSCHISYEIYLNLSDIYILGYNFIALIIDFIHIYTLTKILRNILRTESCKTNLTWNTDWNNNFFQNYVMLTVLVVFHVILMYDSHMMMVM
jgi:hypothetical protein